MATSPAVSANGNEVNGHSNAVQNRVWHFDLDLERYLNCHCNHNIYQNDT